MRDVGFYAKTVVASCTWGTLVGVVYACVVHLVAKPEVPADSRQFVVRHWCKAFEGSNRWAVRFYRASSESEATHLFHEDIKRNDCFIVEVEDL